MHVLLIAGMGAGRAQPAPIRSTSRSPMSRPTGRAASGQPWLPWSRPRPACSSGRRSLASPDQRPFPGGMVPWTLDLCREPVRRAPGGAMSCPAASCPTATMSCWDRAGRPVPVTRGCALTPRLSWACLLLASPAMAGQRASGASQPGSWTAGWKAATPTHLSSSAASAVTIPTWTTLRSPAGCSASAGHTLLTRAL